MQNIELTWLDRFVGWLSPRAMYERIAWRVATRNYDAGGFRRSNDGWVATNQPGAAVDRAYRDGVRARARDLERNSDIEESIIRAYERNVVGTGFKLQAKVKDAEGEEVDEINSQIEALWKEWCRPRNCDIQGRLSFAEMCRMITRRKLVDGGIFVIKSYTAGGVAPLTLQLREVDELDISYQAMKLEDGNYLVDGIEVDAYGKHVAYYFKTFTPDGYMTLDPQRVPADRVIYLQRITRPSQVREMSPFAPSLSRIRDINQYIEALNVQARVAACFAAIIKKVIPGMAGLGRGAARTKTDADTDFVGQTITPGMIYSMQPGEDVSVVNPPSLGSSAKDLLAIQQRLAGSGQGLSYEVASRDMSQVNYSSARQGLLEDQEEYREEQQYMVDHLLIEVYTSFLISVALAGKLPFTVQELLADKARYMAHEFIPKGWKWIDPVKESNANKIALVTGQDTLARICAEQGLDWREVIAQRGREIALMREAGIPVGGESNAANSAGPAASADGN